MIVNDNNTGSDKLSILIPYDDIIKRVKELSREISDDYDGKPLVIVGLLKGAFFFLADILRELTIPFHIDFINISSYSGTTPAEKVKHLYGPTNDISGKHVIIVDDIIDTGATIRYTVEMIKQKGAIDVKVCTLIKRETKEKRDVDSDYTGFMVKDGFIVGYGLDHNEDYRNLKDIFILNE